MNKLVFCYLGSFILFLSFTTSTHETQAAEPLSIKVDKVYHTVIGDGLESGLKLRFQAIEDSQMSSPYIDIPGADNTANCQLKNIQLVSDEVFEPGGSGNVYFLRRYDAHISTEVLADSGGCLIWIKNGHGKTVSIINYDYYIEF